MKKTLKQFFILYMVMAFLSPAIALAATCGAGGTTPNDPSCAGTVSLTNPLTGSNTNVSPQAFIGRIINAVLGIVGSLALVMFIYGGFTWMMAAGSAEKVKKGRDIMVWAALGLVVIFSSYALTKFIIDSIKPK